MSGQEKHNTGNESADQRILQELNYRLHHESKLDPVKIQVEVHNGEVLLKGKADTEEEKLLAEQIASSVEGVTLVKNHLHIDIGFVHALTSFVSQISAEDKEDKEDKQDKEKNKE